MIEMVKRLRARVPNLAVGVVVGLLAGGGAFAVAAQSGQSGDAGVHGGPKPRFHDAGECDLVDVGALEGNWTHGDYVSAVSASDPSKTREAAQSRCGKPDHASSGAAKAKSKAAKDKARVGGSQAPKPKPSPKPSTPVKETTPSPSASLPLPSPSPSPGESPEESPPGVSG